VNIQLPRFQGLISEDQLGLIVPLLRQGNGALNPWTFSRVIDPTIPPAEAPSFLLYGNRGKENHIDHRLEGILYGIKEGIVLFIPHEDTIHHSGIVRPCTASVKIYSLITFEDVSWHLQINPSPKLGLDPKLHGATIIGNQGHGQEARSYMPVALWKELQQFMQQFGM
jgi:hypothetical protein